MPRVIRLCWREFWLVRKGKNEVRTGRKYVIILLQKAVVWKKGRSGRGWAAYSLICWNMLLTNECWLFDCQTISHGLFVHRLYQHCFFAHQQSKRSKINVYKLNKLCLQPIYTPSLGGRFCFFTAEWWQNVLVHPRNLMCCSQLCFEPNSNIQSRCSIQSLMALTSNIPQNGLRSLRERFITCCVTKVICINI